VNGHRGQFPDDPQAVGEASRITRFLVSANTRETSGAAKRERRRTKTNAWERIA
jgi:hypothetical protein